MAGGRVLRTRSFAACCCLLSSRVCAVTCDACCPTGRMSLFCSRPRTVAYLEDACYAARTCWASLSYPERVVVSIEHLCCCWVQHPFPTRDGQVGGASCVHNHCHHASLTG
ncbi:hypothetical protein QBC43DRAFT_314700 [Cladorrhinum sp. PSN259]|nr:hypothetical protein QBC43DRAFT_314700 [Cladorrhinum sp. PSN259]